MRRLFYALMSLCTATGVMEANSLLADDSDEIKQHLMTQLDAIQSTFNAAYAPLEWKREYLGWDFAAEVQAAKDDILLRENVTQKDGQRILRKFFKGLGDYHAAVFFHSTESSTLPFFLAFADDRFFVTYVDKFHPSYKTIPVEVGDEILSFGGKSPKEALDEFMESEFYQYKTGTNITVAAKFLATRMGFIGHEIPKGTIPIEVYHTKKRCSKLYQAQWYHQPEKIPHHWVGSSEEEREEAALPLGQRSYFRKVMSTPLFMALEGIDGSNCNGLKRRGDRQMLMGGNDTPAYSALQKQPNLRVLSRLRTRMQEAFIYLSPSGKKIGYMRIPSYFGEYSDVSDFAHVLRVFQQQTDGLVIDQTDNPGGYFFNMYALASMLTAKPLKTHPHKQAITHSDIVFALENLAVINTVRSSGDAAAKFGHSMAGFPVTYDLIMAFKQHFNFILSEWNAGRWVTNPNPLMGLEYVKPHNSVQYTKPIVMLVDSMSFSCADFMPALLQDNKRATILGTKTAGAGGYILYTSQPNRFAIKNYSYTGSLALRTDMTNPLENLGVTPDIEYNLTAEDYTTNFAGYYKAIQQAIDNLIAQEPVQQKGAQGTGEETPKKKRKLSSVSCEI